MKGITFETPFLNQINYRMLNALDAFSALVVLFYSVFTGSLLKRKRKVNKQCIIIKTAKTGIKPHFIFAYHDIMLDVFCK